MGRHATFKACEHALLLPAEVSAGLSRTHQVLLLLRTIATMHMQTPVHTQTRHHSHYTHINTTIDIDTLPCIHTLRLAGPYIVAFSQLVRPNAQTPPSLRWRQLKADVWAETITAKCPLRPMYLEEHDNLQKNGRKKEEEEYNEGEKEQKNQRQEESDKSHEDGVLQPLQVYVKVPRAEGGEQVGSVNNTGINNDNSTGVSTKTDPILPEESFPPMFFGYKSVSFSNRKRSGGVVTGMRSHNSHSVEVGITAAASGSGSGGVVSVNGSTRSMISLLLKQMSCEVKTLFVNMDGEEYAGVIHKIPSFSFLDRERVKYIAIVEMTIISPSQKSSENSSEEEIWPFNMVVIACCIVYGDELYLYSQPPQRSTVFSCEEGDRNISQRSNKNEPMGEGRKKTKLFKKLDISTEYYLKCLREQGKPSQ
ncbi:hypothetical protein LSM04_009645 [Trypanosoma melophagium]|uniref:uncharacterized protein n=1 Tax=Trypanosoma melophagium TaxID=715481 RepID=UPI00351A8829|nr:hypothetical protein LSM04_009645 [Trypanosoma melophagium]